MHLFWVQVLCKFIFNSAVDPTTCWFEEQKKFTCLSKKNIYPFFDEQVQYNKTEKINLVQSIMINGEETSSTPSLLWIRIHTRVCTYTWL